MRNYLILINVQAVIIFTDSTDNTVSDLQESSWPLRKQKVRAIFGDEYNEVRVMAVTSGMLLYFLIYLNDLLKMNFLSSDSE